MPVIITAKERTALEAAKEGAFLGIGGTQLSETERDAG
jgi:hypothetical protein